MRHRASLRNVTAAILLAALAAVSCVGPARTEAQYLADASASAERTASHIESALLVVEQAAAGLAPAAFTNVRLRESEDGADAVVTSFSVVEPPTPAMQGRRQDLLPLLDGAASGLSELRSAASRGDHARLPELVPPLRDLLPLLAEHQQPAPAVSASR